jgi:ribonucleoside-diphosphate reductase, beta subunit
LYRESKIKERKRDIFKPRINLKPYEYPELYEYVDAIRHSYWLHTEFNFTSDIQDFKVNVSPSERNAIQNAMLAIAQIEVAVKTFW